MVQDNVLFCNRDLGGNNLVGTLPPPVGMGSLRNLWVPVLYWHIVPDLAFLLFCLDFLTKHVHPSPQQLLIHE